jgi:hypothetical protein
MNLTITPAGHGLLPKHPKDRRAWGAIYLTIKFRGPTSKTDLQDQVPQDNRSYVAYALRNGWLEVAAQ